MLEHPHIKSAVLILNSNDAWLRMLMENAKISEKNEVELHFLLKLTDPSVIGTLSLELYIESVPDLIIRPFSG